jgi:hypothetical protein
MPRQDDLQIRAQRDAIRVAEYISLLVMSVGIFTDEINSIILLDAFAALVPASRWLPLRY